MKTHLSLALLLAACSGAPSTSVDAPAPKHASSERPRLVLTVVLDQFPSHAALRYLPHLDEDGLLRRMEGKGALVERVRLSYASSATGPGHAAIHTGRAPFESGVDTNDVWDLEKKGEVPLVSRSEGRVHGTEGKTAGPEILLVDTVADVLRARDPESKVVSLSHKDRAAILSAGKSPTMVSWYDYSIPGFTTSTSYADVVPEWLASFNEERPTSSALLPWTAEAPELYETLFGPDDAPGEASWYGLGTTFPHEVASAEKPPKVLLASPHGASYLLDAVRAAAAHYELGKDEHTDLLAVSISTTDYAGHSYSSSSWEYLDVLRKVDRELGVLVRELEADIGASVTVLLTSDHGGPLMPEQSGEGGRIIHKEIAPALDAVVDAKLGEGSWVAAYVEPYIYLSSEGVKREAEVAAALVEGGPAIEGVERVVPPAVARSWIGSDDPLEDAVARSVAPHRKELYLVPSPGYFADAERYPDVGKGVNHGTAVDDDREVPVFAMGPAVIRTRIDTVLPQARVAATIAALVGVEAPNGEEALPIVRDASRPATP